MSMKLASTFLLAAMLALNVSVSSAADPSLHEVYQAAEAGNYRSAQAMMDQVLRDHPNSAKAHFVEAELLAKQGQTSGAKAELNTAEKLDPGLAFAKPGALQELRTRLSPAPMASSVVRSNASPVSEPSLPWGMILIVVAAVALLIFFLRSRQQPATVISSATGTPSFGTSGGFGQNPQPYGAGGVGPMPMPGSGGGIGSGILGGLATGAAVGAGMVAGEVLMHRVLDGGQHSSGNYIPADTPRTDSQPQYDMGGNDFGVNDSSSWDDSGGGGGGGDDWS